MYYSCFLIYPRTTKKSRKQCLARLGKLRVITFEGQCNVSWSLQKIETLYNFKVTPMWPAWIQQNVIFLINLKNWLSSRKSSCLSHLHLMISLQMRQVQKALPSHLYLGQNLPKLPWLCFYKLNRYLSPLKEMQNPFTHLNISRSHQLFPWLLIALPH